MRQRLRLLSPHRDDAAFSLFTFLSDLDPPDVAITVINFFTVSGYGPWTAADEPSRVSAIRRSEDRKVLPSLSAPVRIVDRNLVDAPLRLEIPVSTVCHPDPESHIGTVAIETVGRFDCTRGAELVLAPLGLGNHIDHLIVRAAALESCQPSKLAFYEDLPYAMWTAVEAVVERVREVEAKLKTKLRRYQIKRKGAAWLIKKRAIAQYQSQITVSDAERIARWGEAIWIPAGSKFWTGLLRPSLVGCR